MSTALTVQDLTQEKRDLIKETVAKGATDLELELFFYVCKQTGLDPLAKQIYAIKRWSQTDGKEVMSFQTGIDGLRLIADRTGHYAGSSDAIFDEKDGKPILAQVTVLKIVAGEKCAFTASARYEEYVQRNRERQPTSMWARMPYVMLAKCAEAQALRKAFPMEMSGLHTNEEMSHLESDWKESLQGKPSDITARLEAQEGAAPSVSVGEALENNAGNTASPAPSDDLFVQGSAIADHELALDECKTSEELQKAWDEVVKDKRLSSETRPALYQRMIKLAKGLKKK